MIEVHSPTPDPTRQRKHWYSKPRSVRFSRFFKRKRAEANVEPQEEEPKLQTVASIHSEEETPGWDAANFANSTFFSSPENPLPGIAVTPTPGDQNNLGAVRPEVATDSHPNSGLVPVTASTDPGIVAPPPPLSPNPEYEHRWPTKDRVIKASELADTTVPEPDTTEAQGEPEAESQGPVFELSGEDKDSDPQNSDPTELSATSPVENTMGNCLGRETTRRQPSQAGRIPPFAPELPRPNFGRDYVSQQGPVQQYNQAGFNQTSNQLHKNFQDYDANRPPPPGPPPPGPPPPRPPPPTRPCRPGDPLTYHGEMSPPPATYRGQTYSTQRYSPYDETRSNTPGFQGGEVQPPDHQQSFGGSVQENFNQAEFGQSTNSRSRSRLSLAPLKRWVSSRGDNELQTLHKMDFQTLETYEGLSSDWGIMKQLFEDYKIPKPPNIGNPPLLSRIIHWIPTQLKELKSEVAAKDNEIKNQNTQIKSQESQIKSLKESLETMTTAHGTAHDNWVDTKASLTESTAKVSSLENKLAEMEARIKELGTELIKDKTSLADSIQECGRLRQANEDREETWKDWHAEQIALHVEQARIASNAHRKELDRLEVIASQTKIEHDTKVLNMKAEHETILKKETSELKERLGSLQRHMAVQSSTGGYMATPDDEFRSKFMGLARRINNLIAYAPRPESLSLDSSLDPNGFLVRNLQQGGRNWPKFIRNICWRVIVKGFFTRQLGFGALGPQGSPGFEFLDQTFQLSCVPSPEDTTVKIWPNTSADNIYRAGFFKAISKAVHDKSRSRENTCYLRFYHDNVVAVTNELASILFLASQRDLSSQATTEIAGIVEGFALLALDMGSQRAHVYVETCEYGRVIKAGDPFVDETESRSGGLTVDLMTQPSVRRVGDGREDLKLQRAIVKGDFIALRTG